MTEHDRRVRDELQDRQLQGQQLQEDQRLRDQDLRERQLRDQGRQDKRLRDRVREREAAREGTARDETARDETARDETARDETARDEAAAERREQRHAPASILRQAPGPKDGPAKPTQLPTRALVNAVKRSAKEFKEDNLPDWAAALTYYSVLSIFPGILVLVSIVGLVGQNSIQPLLDNITQIAPGAVGDILTGAVESLQDAPGAASLAGIIGLLIAFWSASRYVAAFMRASNAIYDVPEGRPAWKKLPIRLGVTVVIGLMLVASAIIVVVSGDLATAIGETIGLRSTTVTMWNIAKWPVLLVIVALMFAVLYRASPNARQGGFRWVSPGGFLAVLLWVAASALFALYAANFSSYNETYGTLAGIIIFLVWLWISNLAILFGAELDAELERQRAIAAGHPTGAEPYMQMRDTRKVEPGSGLG
jgi:membrane protein